MPLNGDGNDSTKSISKHFYFKDGKKQKQRNRNEYGQIHQRNMEKNNTKKEYKNNKVNHHLWRQNYEKKGYLSFVTSPNNRFGYAVNQSVSVHGLTDKSNANSKDVNSIGIGYECGFYSDSLTGSNNRSSYCNDNYFHDTFFQTDNLFPQQDMLLPIGNNSSPSQQRSKKRDSEKQLKSKTVSKTISKKESIRNNKPTRKDNRKSFVHSQKDPVMSWRDYRQAMKPFKNKDFYNAKRVVQRLGKKDPSELDEKEKLRLANAQEKIKQYKQRRTEKGNSYVKSNEQSSKEMGELFVLKKVNTINRNDKQENYKNSGNFGQPINHNTNLTSMGECRYPRSPPKHNFYY